MSFKLKINCFLKKQKEYTNLTVENIEYLETLLDNLNFKYNAINYHIKRIAEVKEELDNLAKEKCEINQKKVSQNDTQTGSLFEELQNGIKGKTSFSTTKMSISYSEEIDSSKLFFEFESLLFEISSFIDYSFKILKIFFPNIKTSKSKIVKSVSKNYLDSELEKYLKGQFSSWINELLKYRDHIMHLSSLNSNIGAKVSNSPSWGSITQRDGKSSIIISSETNTHEVQPIYLPLEPDFKHKIVDKLAANEINYEDDFYIFEDYVKKLMAKFQDYALNIFDKIK